MNSCLKNIYPLSKFQRPETALPGFVSVHTTYSLSVGDMESLKSQEKVDGVCTALATCPLYNVVRERLGFSPDQNELIDSLSDQSLTPARHGLLPSLKLDMPYYLSTKSMSNTTKVPTSIITVVAVLHFNIYPT